MGSYFPRSIVAAATIAVACASAAGRARGQDEAPNPSRRVAGPTPRTADGKVDFSGIWSPDRKFIYDINDALKPGETLPLQPWALKTARQRMSKDDPEANCLPTGIPRVAPYPWRLVQYPTHKKATHVFFLFEGNIHSYRQVFMDGREHPVDPDPTWYGHSIGRYEGDTLVIDTIGFNDKFWFDFRGHPHTEKLHTIERYTRKDLGTLLVETTIDDPGAYSRPFKVAFTARLRPNEELMEYICQENNQDVAHIHGPAGEPGAPGQPAGTSASPVAPRP